MGAKRIGTSRTLIVAFEREKVPRYVRDGSLLYRCSLYMKQIEVCRCCGRVGHRGNVCPTPNAKACLSCRVSNPKDGHKCVPKCKLCGQRQPTGDKTCKARFKIPFMVRRRRWERRSAERQRVPSPNSFPQFGDVTWRERIAPRGARRTGAPLRGVRHEERRHE